MRKTKDGNRIVYKNKWMELCFLRGSFSLKYSLGGYFDRKHQLTVCLWLFSAYITLPWGNGIEDCETPEYGIYYHANALVLCYGMEKRKYFYMPWTPEWVRTSLLMKDGTWEHEYKGSRKEFWRDEWKGKMFSFTEPYTYVLQSGKLQHVNATCRVEEREWRPRWFKWTSLFKNVCRTIDVSFDNEVGEQSGSWKGGCTGCGYDIKPGETPQQTLRRMQVERKFN